MTDSHHINYYVTFHIFPVVTVIAQSGQDPSSYYYGHNGYTQYNNVQEYLAGAEELLFIRFKSCMPHGLLIYATNLEEAQYFAVGVSNSRIIVEFNLGRGVREVLS